MTSAVRYWLILFASVLMACSSSDRDRTLLRVANDAEPKGLDPHVVTGMSEYYILQSLFEGLVQLDADTLEPMPGVAESWTLSDDGKIYTFNLNPNAKWSNGDPVTAMDFMYAFQRILNPNMAAQYAFLLFYIKGAKPYNSGEIEGFDHVGVSCLDPQTLQIELENPTPFFLSLLPHFAYYPVHPATIDAFDAFDKRGTRWTRSGNMVSNGPFMLADWKLGQYVEVDRNPHYWKNDATKMESIQFYPIKNAMTEQRAFMAKQIDVTARVAPSQVKHLIDTQSPYLQLEPDLGVYFYLFNTKHPVLKDIRVRKALSMAVNRELISRQIRQRGEPAAYGFVPVSTSEYMEGSELIEDAEKARVLLKEAGYPDGKGFPELELLYNRSDNHRQIAVAIQQMWKHELGINVTLVNQTWKIYLNSRQTGDYEICRAGWLADYNDPMTFLEIWKQDAGINETGWQDDAFDTLLQRASAATDSTIRRQLLSQAESILIESLPAMPLFFYNRAYLKQPYVKAWPSNVMGIRDYRRVYLEE